MSSPLPRVDTLLSRVVPPPSEPHTLTRPPVTTPRLGKPSRPCVWQFDNQNCPFTLSWSRSTSTLHSTTKVHSCHPWTHVRTSFTYQPDLVPPLRRDPVVLSPFHPLSHTHKRSLNNTLIWIYRSHHSSLRSYIPSVEPPGLLQIIIDLGSRSQSTRPVTPFSSSVDASSKDPTSSGTPDRFLAPTVTDPCHVRLRPPGQLPFVGG